MAFPTPVPGLILRYSYLWHRESLAGADEGRKDRPCVIIASVRTEASGQTRVLVLPMTHAEPDSATTTMELPTKVKRRLGLDGERSWVVLSEWNEFRWPGPDLRSIPGAPDGGIAYGLVPPGFFADMRDCFVALVKNRKSRSVPRD